MSKFNYCCIKDGCDSKTIQLSDKKPVCLKCGRKLKRLGIVTSIVHKGTQESKI